MPLFTRTEIREICGINTATLSTYTKRNKIIMSGDFIDDAVAQNKTQIDKWKAAKIKKDLQRPDKSVAPKKEEKEVAPTKKGKTKKGDPKYAEPILPDPKALRPPPDPDDPIIKQKIAESNARLKLDDDTKRVTYEQKLLAKEKVAIELEHTKGKLIPTKLVSEVISALGVGFQNAYKNEASQLLIEIAQKTKMSDKDSAFFKGKLIDMINKAHTNSIKEAKDALKSLIEQHQEKK
jgi:hypothetical protein